MKSKLQDLCEQAGLETRSYSGRAMYGKSCLGVVVGSFGEFLSPLMEALEGVVDLDDKATLNDYLFELREKFMDLRTDNMGHDIIIYFPRTPFEDEDSEDDLEEDEETDHPV